MLPQHSDIEIAWYASIQQEPNGWKTVTTQFYIQEFSEYIAPLVDSTRHNQRHIPLLQAMKWLMCSAPVR